MINDHYITHAFSLSLSFANSLYTYIHNQDSLLLSLQTIICILKPHPRDKTPGFHIYFIYFQLFNFSCILYVFYLLLNFIYKIM